MDKYAYLLGVFVAVFGVFAGVFGVFIAVFGAEVEKQVCQSVSEAKSSRAMTSPGCVSSLLFGSENWRNFWRDSGLSRKDFSAFDRFNFDHLMIGYDSHSFDFLEPFKITS